MIKYIIYSGKGIGNDTIILTKDLTAYGINASSKGWFDCTETFWDYMIGDEELANVYDTDKADAVRLMRINGIDEKYVKEVEEDKFPHLEEN